MSIPNFSLNRQFLILGKKLRRKGPSVNYVHSNVVILDPLPACTCTYSFILHPLPSSTSVRILFFKEDMADILCELLSIKEPKTLHNKEAIVQRYRKISNQNEEEPWNLVCVFYLHRGDGNG